MTLLVALFVLTPTSAAVALPPLEPSPAGVDPTLKVWPSWPYPTTLGEGTFDPTVAFAGPTGVEAGSRPTEVGLRALLANREYASVFEGFETGWRFVNEGPDYAIFARGRLPSLLSTEVVRRPDGSWGAYGGSCHDCAPRSIVRGEPAVEWKLAGETLRPNMRSISVVLTRGYGCTPRGGASAAAAKPVFRQIGRKLLMAISLKSSAKSYSWLRTCVIESGPPLEVRLPGRLGRRTLFDAGSYPPQIRRGDEPFPEGGG